MLRALIVDDDVASLKALATLVAQEGFETTTAETLGQARLRVAEGQPDIVLCDLMLPDGSGNELLAELAEVRGVEVVLVTGRATVETAVEALRLGAHDYLTKPVDAGRLVSLLAGVRRTVELKRQVSGLRDELRQLGRFGAIIGRSEAMQRVFDLIEKVAPTDATVLIVGESGTGKDVVAQTLHDLSRRRKAPFVPINCGAISPSLIETELFGHEKGSFTGANRQHQGYFEQADGGTLFLDEITEMPIELQVKLLRVLETGTVLRVGGSRPLRVDVRVLAATNRDPLSAVKAGRLREDLYYRLRVFPIQLPPLRDRDGDVALLARHFLDRIAEQHGGEKPLRARALKRLESHGWPGNVRELRNTLERAYILADDEIHAEHVVLEGVEETPRSGSRALELEVGGTIAEAERRLILATLEELEGNKPAAAAALGISLKTLYNRLNAYGS